MHKTIEWEVRIKTPTTTEEYTDVRDTLPNLLTRIKNYLIKQRQDGNKRLSDKSIGDSNLPQER